MEGVIDCKAPWGKFGMCKQNWFTWLKQCTITANNIQHTFYVLCGTFRKWLSKFLRLKLNDISSLPQSGLAGNDPGKQTNMQSSELADESGPSPIQTDSHPIRSLLGQSHPFVQYQAGLIQWLTEEQHHSTLKKTNSHPVLIGCRSVQ